MDDTTDDPATAHDAIVPDDKDWTWVLDTPCPECGFDATGFAVAQVGDLIRENAASFADVLERPADQLRTRPNPSTWSALEYGAHVRDVYRLYLERLRLMLAEDDPLFPDWDQDETAVADRYNEQDPPAVRGELLRAAEELAVAFDAVDGERWQRRGRRSDGTAFTIETFARYMIHDPIHHLDDVQVA